MIREVNSLITPPPKKILADVFLDVCEEKCENGDRLFIYRFTEDDIFYNRIAKGDYRQIYFDYYEIRLKKNGHLQENNLGFTKHLVTHTPDNTYYTLTDKFAPFTILSHLGNPNYDYCWTVQQSHLTDYSHIYSRFIFYLE